MSRWIVMILQSTPGLKSKAIQDRLVPMLLLENTLNTGTLRTDLLLSLQPWMRLQQSLLDGVR